VSGPPRPGLHALVGFSFKGVDEILRKEEEEANTC